MAHNCRRLFTLAPLKRAFLQKPNATPVRNVWSLTRPNDFRNIIRDMDRTMERFEKEIMGSLPFRALAPRMIPIEGVGQHGQAYRLNLDVSGFKPEEVKVAVKDNVLKIQAKMERKGEDGSKFQQEIVREMTLPDNVDTSELKSFLGNDGILRLEAAYKPAEKPKEIPVSKDQ